jgi:Tfp pilus assembly protein PilF
MRGIGKRALVQEAFRQAIPPRKRVWLQLTEGMSYQRLLAELAYGCNLQLPENLNLSSAATQGEVTRRIFSYLGQGPGAVVVLADFQYLLHSSGEPQEASVRDLLVGLAEAGQRGRTKYLVISYVSPRLGPLFENYCAPPYTLHGLQPRDTERLLARWLQLGRDELAGQLPAPSERLISTLGGHPLATKIAARLWAEHPTGDIAEDLSVFTELRDTIVSFILEKLTLSPGEEELLLFASILRLPAPRDVFKNWRKEEANYLLNSLAGQYLIEVSDKGYQLHPLIRSYFSNRLSSEQANEFHKIAGKFYLEEFDRVKKSTKQVVPEYLGEAVHHYLAAGDRSRVKEFAFYRQELRPVALEHYRRGDLRTALRDYKILLEIDRNDLDAHFHLTLIFSRLGRWDDAELHFGQATAINPKAYWILEAFGASKLRAGKLAEGEALLLDAEEINPRHSPTLVELGYLREKQGHSVEAEDYYRRAIEADPNNSYAYYRLSRFLYHEGDIKEAFAMANAALASNPLNNRNKALVQELKAKAASA